MSKTATTRKPKVVPTKQMLAERRKALQKRKKERELQAKRDAESPLVRATREKREAMQLAARQAKGAEAERARRAARDAYAKQVEENCKARKEQREAEQKAAHVAAAAVLRAEEDKADEAPATPARPSARAAPVARADGAIRTAPTVAEMETGAAYVPKRTPMPSLEVLGCMASASVVYADAQVGLGAWGAGAGEWARPVRWLPLVERLNRRFVCGQRAATRAQAEDDDGTCCGEYNAIFFPGADREVDALLPPLRDGDGRAVPTTEVIVRTTRPDADLKDNGDPYYRYKPLASMQREFYYTLHGAVHGYAPECLAAVLYPAVDLHRFDGTTTRLYGTLYVMRKARKDLNALLDDEVARVRAEHGAVRNTPAETDALGRVGRKAALWMLPLICRQSRLGALSFDAKPANYVFGNDARLYAIDFDAAMYTLADDGPCNWHAHLLMHLLLLTAHVRSYVTANVARGWAAALRALLLELCTRARAARWLYEARLVAREFKELVSNSDDDARRRLEMMVHTYFTRPEKAVRTPFRPRQPASLLRALAAFCLHGDADAPDVPLDAALGCPKAARQLATTR